MIKLTGKRRYRAAPDGTVVLQVQEATYHTDFLGPSRYAKTPTTWRDARVEDLTEHVFEAGV
ncbi:hypothetical protein IFT84_13575 [Rhizobium sp. CFBP 8762]|uniref:hypothetical protein n=1 Tax=Rhizobium sp. CFBP 8762 TaxID=2775279 RepID=UPI001780901C|nr:hypothetical protein [Rhizobium sp. CFBP 8762]MBD8555537.1 hypothetical protein [Rhizobium sp. CFBP 8762]